MTFDSLYATLFTAPLMLPLLGSLLTGVLIGAEREAQGKPAGLRTHTLVCFGSALMMLIAARQISWDTSMIPGTQIVSDMSRMPHAILTGIGFLCAGVIFREGLSVQGLTTAASLWVTASLGIVYGAGMLELATISTLIVLAVLVALRVMQYVLPAHSSLRISVVAQSGYRCADLAAQLSARKLRPGSIAMTQSTRSVTLTTTVTQPKRGLDLDALCAELQENPLVKKVSLDPED
ncbi:MgtC/SapB family protein [Pseudotabrizicola alkalilacus]|uniref:Protein MgtC n=1 Tax=Pseudotabrizicola alkalilacus TaxID=2305252 RepID=A0A411Z6R4_9RHOB|nr:MgtC/SapB family protein [Pseudotabrizicola alkalilacus]RGP38717.1 MgtC/SapB family protein [Pseudotabrizicola alkalilacus]